jgi:hypothetical protein
MIDVNFSVAARAREKQIAREQDDARLRSGSASRDDIQRENGFFSKLDLSRAVIVKRRGVAFASAR